MWKNTSDEALVSNWYFWYLTIINALEIEAYTWSCKGKSKLSNEHFGILPTHKWEYIHIYSVKGYPK